jgi:glycerophosphoryl diester phosphodiesterase
MGPREYDISRDYLPRLKADIEHTIAAYRKASDLRARKIEQDLEQIKVYFEILEQRRDKVTLSQGASKKLNGVLTWKPKNPRKNPTHRKHQDQLEKHFFEIQKVLVGLISKRFKY